MLSYNDLLHEMRILIWSSGKTQKQIALHFGMDTGNFSKILTGVIKPSAKFFVELLDYLGYSIVKPLNL